MLVFSIIYFNKKPLIFILLKALTLYNNYKVILSKPWIYLFAPDLDMIYSSDFREIQQITENDAANYISNGNLAQFSGEDGETKYILYIVRKIIYIMAK